MISAKEILNQLLSRGYSFFTGVPCSFLNPLISYVSQSNSVNYVAAIQRRLISTKGVVEFVDGTGKKAVVGDPQVCNSLNWAGAMDGLTYLILNLGFSGGCGENK